MRVLFWGTPEFATPTLRALIGEGFDVVGVVTQPDRPVGRSRSTLEAPPVKRVALEAGLPVLQPERPRGDEFMAQLRELAPDVSVVIAYGHILREEVLALPPMGSFNVHASLLPKLRGAAPIQAAIREGFDETGISIIRLVRAMDAGPVIHRVVTPIAPDETAGELTLRLSELGALAMVEALALLDLGQVAEAAQDEAEATYAPKIDRDNSRVDWQAPARTVSCLIRSLDPRPGAWTTHHGEDLKLFGARLAPGVDGTEGEVSAIDDEGMTICCGSGSVRVSTVQPAGKRRMPPAEWARGRGIAVGDRLA